MDMFRAIKTLALLEVTAKYKSENYELRRVRRWYSQTFFTPLHLVDDLPIFQLMQAYYENGFEQMEPNELNEALIEITQTPEERAAALTKEQRAESDDDLFFKEVQAEALQQKSLPKPETRPALPISRTLAAETQLPNVKLPPAELKMTFITPEELERLTEADSLDPIIDLE